MQAKTQVLGLIRGLMVKDIQNFVDWLKTVRVQYNAGGKNLLKTVKFLLRKIAKLKETSKYISLGLNGP